MNKQKILKVVNVFLAISFLFTAGGGVMRALVPETIPYGLFSMLHPKFGMLLVVCVILHLWLNWAWIRSTFFRKAAK